MNTSKKIASMALTITTSVWMSGALFLIPVAQAQTTTDLQAQISALLLQIQQLQAQLQAGGGVSSSFSFTRDLTVGSKGADVTALQQTLINGGYLTAVSAPTGYFGSLTKAAVAAWQAAKGVSPAVGYFGPKTRAALSAMVAVTPTPTPTPTPGTVQLPAPASGLQVGLASNNPAAGSLIAGSARASVLAVTLTAGNASGITVNDLKFTKTGVVSDNSISGAYLVENGKVLNQYQSLSNGVIAFGGLGLNIAAGQTRQLWLQIDTASGVNAGNTVSFAVASASNVMATDATGASVTALGAFPVNGNTFTVTTVSNPSIGSMTVASTSIGTQVTAGTQNNIVGGWQFTVANSAVNLKTINFKVIGSANKGDLRNVKLFVNGAQVGSTLASVASDGTAFFDLSSAPARLNTGTNNIQVFADVMGSPSFKFQVEILNAYDIYAIDTQYNVPVLAGSNVGTEVTIKQGSITVTQDPSTPTGNIAKGQTGITLAKFALYAAGEAVKIKWLGFKLVFGTGAGNTLDTEIKNVHLDDDAGGQLGTTINSLVTAVTCTDTAQTTATTTANNCFGNSTSPINYIVPANTTRVFSLRGDIQSGAGFATVTASLVGNTSNLQGLTSSQTASSGSVAGGALSLASTALTVAKNSGFGTPTYAANTTNRKIGSYSFTASSAEGTTISNLTVKTGIHGNVLQNLAVKIGSTQFGSTQATLGVSQSFSFSGTPFTVPSGGTTLVDVFADVLSTASGTLTTASILSGCSGSGMISFSAITCTSTNGQDVAIAGQPALQVALDSGSPAANQIVMGSTGNTLATFLFTETSNADSIKITDLQLKDTVSATSTVLQGFQNLCLYSGATNLGCAGAGGVNGTSSDYLYAFHFTNPVVVGQAQSLALALKGDVSSFASSGASDNTTHAFKFDTSGAPGNDTVAELITALGLTSNATATITTSTTAVPTGNTMTVLRTKLTVTGSPLGIASGRAKAAVDDLGTLNFAADAAGTLMLGSVTVTFSGSGPSTTNFFNTTSTSGGNSVAGQCSTCFVTLFDSALNKSYFALTSSTANTTLGYDLNNYTLSAGATKSFVIRLNSSQTGVLEAAKSGVSLGLTATIGAAANVNWTDAISGGIAGLTLPAVVIPVNINSTSYAAGS